MNKYDETIKKMQDITTEIAAKADRACFGQDEETVTKIKAVSTKTIDVINEAAIRLKDAIEKVSNEEELNRFLERVEEKCENAKNYAYAKFNELAPDAEYVVIEEEDKTVSKSSMEKFMDNENVKQAAKMATNLKEDAIKFIKDPNTKKKVDDVALAALNVADKGLDFLLKFLDK
ncbi:MAG: hypothetical protein Q4B60_00130 [Erysipelotrichaceae bacterium]|nr:hypothetical protein [Erysipelotrichaceae bacterium]